MKHSFLYLFILILLGFSHSAFAQNGELYGTVTDENNAPFPGVIVKVTQGGLVKGGTVTEDDGTYSVKPLQAGTYSIQFSTMGYATKEIGSITVSNGGSVKINNKMSTDAKNLKEVVKVQYKQPVVNKITAVGSEKIERAPTRNLLDMASLGPNVQQSRNGGELRIGGARGDGTVYMLDGQIIQGAVTPAQGTVDQLQVFSSGIPANLGDATGGVVYITSKGMSSTLKGTVQAQHSVDGYNQNLVNASFTGPLVSKTRDGVKEPILGFLAGIDYQYDQDDNPTFTKNPVLKSDVLKRMQDNPLTLYNTSTGNVMLPSSNTVTKNDFNLQKRQLNNSSQTVRFNGKLDYALTDKINITAGGNFNYNNSQAYSRSNSYFAPEAIPNQIVSVYRGYLRFRQSFNNKVSSSTDSVKKNPVISNAYYTIQLDYQRTNSSVENPNFKRNLFDYGYVGKFTQSRMPFYSFGTDSISGRKAVLLQTYDLVSGISFDPSNKNPILANYTRDVYKYADQLGMLTDYTQVQRYRGLMNGDFPNYALDVQNVRIGNIGAGMTGYSYGTFSQVGLHADASFDFKPKKTTHAIQFGLYYEQRSQSNYSANINLTGTGNNSLWNRMMQLSNSHILGLDYANPIFVHNGVHYTKDQVDAGAFFGPTDTIIYNRLNNGDQSNFDRNLRSRLGLGASDYIDIHSVDPSKLSLDLFSADELINNGASFVSYNGYDYLGNKQKGNTNFNDFFTAKANGQYTRPIAAFSPNYIAGYVMDKFRFQDMNFNVGVRIERYDNNTKVLKDPYSLYELNRKNGVDGARNIINGGKHPGNIGDDYAVYVNNNQSANPSVIGYRNGDKWYNAYGVEIADPSVLKLENGGTDPTPYLTPGGKTKITDANYDPNLSFTDYKPKVTASPRFQFDFPINDGKALFYAHYDILVQRPKTGNYATPLDYMYLANNTGSLIGNPNLKPEKTFDYELGFQQQVSNNSGIGISAFYRERKDMIQVRPYLFAWPQTYYTFGNRDFSTTKGFTFSYDYRKPKNASIPIEMTLAYTLQFADGTGSSATSSNGGSGSQVATTGLLQNFISAGLPNLRYVAPLTYDSRHNINLNFNYSYDENEGPTINGKHFLQYFNANMIIRARSGEPYTTYQAPIGNAIQGGLNGTRLPWHFGLDMRLDKRFMISGFARKAAEGEAVVSTSTAAKRKYYLTAFVYFQNLFNIRNVLGVYPYTSRPDDDGYITSPNGKQYVNQSINSTAVYDLYNLYINNPGFYDGPRRINVGFSFSF